MVTRRAFYGLVLLALVPLSLAQQSSLAPRVLSFRQQAAATSGFPDQTSLVAHWRLEEDSDGTRDDAIGANNLEESSGDTIPRAAGKLGTYSADLEYSEIDSLSIADTADLSMGAEQSFTLVAWVNIESTGPSYAPIISKGVTTGSGTNEFAVYYRGSTTKFYFGMSDGASAEQTLTQSGTTADTGVWHLVVAIHDATANKMYLSIDGDATPDEASRTAGSFDSSGAFYIGRFGSTTTLSWDGQIDSVSVWKRALSTSEIEALWAAGAGVDLP